MGCHNPLWNGRCAVLPPDFSFRVVASHLIDGADNCAQFICDGIIGISSTAAFKGQPQTHALPRNHYAETHGSKLARKHLSLHPAQF